MPASKQVLNFAGAMVCACMMAYALYAEHVLLLDPCPLCVFQRFAVIALGFVLLAAAIQNPSVLGARLYAGLSGSIAIVGAAIAAWHVRLQNLPPGEVPSCGPGLDYIVENFPLSEMFALVFKGSGECAEVSWRFLGLSMPAWVVAAMLGLAVFVTWNNLRRWPVKRDV